MIYLVAVLTGVPLAVISGLIAYKRNADKPWIKPLAMVIGIGLTCLGLKFAQQGMMSVPEMLHYQYKQITFYEEWNEWIEDECCSTTCSGSGQNETCTETCWDCSYEETHPAYCEAMTNVGSHVRVSKSTFNQAVGLWKNKAFRDMHRDYHTKDGDAYYTLMPDSANHPKSPRVLGYSKQASYVNKVVFSRSVFNYVDVPPEDIPRYGLYKWSASPLMGSNHTYAKMLINNSNLLYGAQRQLSLRVMIYKNKGADVAFLQESLWNGGNKNEFNVCIGIDSDNNIEWVKIISWTTNEKLKLEVRDDIAEMKKLDMTKVAEYLVDKVPRNFVRRQFAEFDYLPDATAGWMYWLSIGLNLVFFIISFFVKLPKRFGRRRF